jgi:hypothetical protein
MLIGFTAYMLHVVISQEDYNMNPYDENREAT